MQLTQYVGKQKPHASTDKLVEKMGQYQLEKQWLSTD
jgi:hypothetical protein